MDNTGNTSIIDTEKYLYKHNTSNSSIVNNYCSTKKKNYV
jgi:hypothetical protein